MGFTFLGIERWLGFFVLQVLQGSCRFRILGFWGIRILGFLGPCRFRILGFLGIRILGFLGPGILGS